MTNINNLLQQAFNSGQSPWYFLSLAFFAGVLVSFTPCVYPMIPITAGILHAQAGRSLLFNFLSSLLYVTGIALVYASLGYLSATTSMMFGKWLSNPIFIACIIIFFLYLAFAMFGFYDFYVPQFLSHNAQQKRNGTLLNSLIFGIISGTVASPCLTPALAILLGIVAKQANPVLGFFTLFVFALGMGILLLLIGTFSATLTLLPRAGAWMNEIKRMFGFLMLASCIYFAQPFLSDAIIFAGYALIATIATLFYLLHARTSRMALVLGIISGLVALTLYGYTLKMLL